MEIEGMRPEFVDNHELTLADALNGHLDWMEASFKTPAQSSGRSMRHAQDLATHRQNRRAAAFSEVLE